MAAELYGDMYDFESLRYGPEALASQSTTNCHPEFIFRIYLQNANTSMSKPTKRYYVYILANRGKMLYTGVTSDLHRRLWQHRHSHGSKFIAKY